MHRADECGWRLAFGRRGHELHAALRTLPRPRRNDVRVHRAGIDAGLGRLTAYLIHLRDEGERLVGRGLEVGGNPLPLG
jgi:hypothetical protein